MLRSGMSQPGVVTVSSVATGAVGAVSGRAGAQQSGCTERGKNGQKTHARSLTRTRRFFKSKVWLYPAVQRERKIEPGGRNNCSDGAKPLDTDKKMCVSPQKRAA